MTGHCPKFGATIAGQLPILQGVRGVMREALVERSATPPIDCGDMAYTAQASPLAVHQQFAVLQKYYAVLRAGQII